jgi:hypothetical protein
MTTIIELIAIIVLNCIYTYAYIQLPSELKENIISQCLLAYIICYWISISLPFLKIVNIIQHFGETTTVGIWTRMLYERKCPYVLLKIFNLACLVLGCYFCFDITSFFDADTCSIYTVGNIACTSIKIIIINTIFFLAPFMTLIVYFLCVCFCYLPCLCCDFYKERTRQTRNRRYNYTLVNYLNRYNPIPMPSSDTTCPICLIQADEKPINWTQLVCGHKFHTECISQWLTKHQTCPYCRKTIDLSLLQNQV